MQRNPHSPAHAKDSPAPQDHEEKQKGKWKDVECNYSVLALGQLNT